MDRGGGSPHTRLYVNAGAELTTGCSGSPVAAAGACSARRVPPGGCHRTVMTSSLYPRLGAGGDGGDPLSRTAGRDEAGLRRPLRENVSAKYDRRSGGSLTGDPRGARRRASSSPRADFGAGSAGSSARPVSGRPGSTVLRPSRPLPGPGAHPSARVATPALRRPVAGPRSTPPALRARGMLARPTQRRQGSSSGRTRRPDRGPPAHSHPGSGKER